MKREDIDFAQFPELPGIYLFRGSRNVVLYVGRATDLRSRIRSYFSERLITDRGPRLVEALEKTRRLEVVPTDSVLEAYILEAQYIKKYEPAFNVVDKDNKSFQYVGITREDFPRVLMVRGRELEQGVADMPFSHIFGPFPRGALLKEALRILRRILPYRSSCVPHAPERAPDVTAGIPGKAKSSISTTGKKPRKCFNAQLGLCPGVCVGMMSKKEYAKRIREIVMFFSGRKKQLLTLLEREMKQHANEQEFEKAEEVRRRMFALTHIQDVALISRDSSPYPRKNSVAGVAGMSRHLSGEPVGGTRVLRIEGYDVAHLGGTHTVGVMVVLVDGEPVPSEYRTFTIRDAVAGDDIGALREMLSRRLQHPEWQFPGLIVVDGGKTHIAAVQRVLKEQAMGTPVVSVVKTDKHTPRAVLGAPEYTRRFEKDIVRSNAEAHRFALARHRRKRSRGMFSGK